MLLDTNILIYACRPKHEGLRRFIREHAPSVSVITRVETLRDSRLPRSVGEGTNIPNDVLRGRSYQMPKLTVHFARECSGRKSREVHLATVLST